MKMFTLEKCPGKRFIDKQMNLLTPAQKRKCNVFLNRVSQLFNQVELIEPECREYLSLALRERLKHQLYNDLGFNNLPAKQRLKLKDELFGYVKFRSQQYLRKKCEL